MGLVTDAERQEFESLAAQYPEIAAARNAFEIALEEQLLADAKQPPQHVKKAVEAGRGKIQRIMLDNFDPATISQALPIINKEFETEASGGITLDTIQAYAGTGVDFISIGGLIHQAQSLDLSLKAVII